jgi:hypothetical protein
MAHAVEYRCAVAVARSRKAWLAGWSIVALLALIAAWSGAASGSTARRTKSAATLARPGRCPAKPQQHVRRSSWARARTQLAPTGATAIRLCRYSGGNDHPAGKLVRSRLLTGGAVVSRLVREFDKLPPFPRGAVACPNDDGSEILALFAYPNGGRVTVELDLTGCQGATNGDLVRIAAGFGTPREFGPQLLAELERLTG